MIQTMATNYAAFLPSIVIKEMRESLFLKTTPLFLLVTYECMYVTYYRVADPNFAYLKMLLNFIMKFHIALDYYGPSSH